MADPANFSKPFFLSETCPTFQNVGDCTSSNFVSERAKSKLVHEIKKTVSHIRKTGLTFKKPVSLF